MILALNLHATVVDELSWLEEVVFLLSGYCLMVMKVCTDSVKDILSHR